MIKKVLLFLFLMPSAFLLAESPFEPGSRGPSFFSDPEKEEDFLDRANAFYQDVLSSDTIHRCPFHTSCSHFAVEQVRHRGAFLGGLYFIDRYFFRENQGAFQIYSFLQDENGVYKLNDQYFLPAD